MTDKKDVIIPDINQIIDISSIKKQIEELQASPNVVRAYLNSIKKRTISREQREVLKEVEEWYQQIADGLIAQTRAYNAKTRLDIARDPKIQNLKKTEVKLSLEESIEQKRRNILKYKKEQEALKSVEQNTRKTKKQKEIEKFRENIEIENALDNEKQKIFEKYNKEELIKIAAIKKDSLMDDEEKQIRIDEIRQIYYNKRSKLYE